MLLGKILRIDPRPDGDRPYGIPASNPFAKVSALGGARGLPEIFASARRIIVPEMNFGQAARLLTSEFPQFKFETIHKVQGKPFFAPELKAHFRKILEETA